MGQEVPVFDRPALLVAAAVALGEDARLASLRLPGWRCGCRGAGGRESSPPFGEEGAVGPLPASAAGPWVPPPRCSAAPPPAAPVASRALRWGRRNLRFICRRGLLRTQALSWWFQSTTRLLPPCVLACRVGPESWDWIQMSAGISMAVSGPRGLAYMCLKYEHQVLLGSSDFFFYYAFIIHVMYIKKKKEKMSYILNRQATVFFFLRCLERNWGEETCISV